METFPEDRPESDPVRVLERLVGGGRRFRSDAGGRAILVPSGTLPVEATTGASVGGPGAVDLLFVDPATGADARALLGLLGLLGRSGASGPLRVALPEGADAAGLAPDPRAAPFAVGPAVYRVYQVADAGGSDRDRLRAAPRVGESADVADQRSKWFQAREGGRG